MQIDYRENCCIILGCNSMKEHLIYGEIFEGHLRNVVRTCEYCEKTRQGDFVTIYHSDDQEIYPETITTACEQCHKYL